MRERMNECVDGWKWREHKALEMPGIEPGASRMRSERSTTELHPRGRCGFVFGASTAQLGATSLKMKAHSCPATATSTPADTDTDTDTHTVTTSATFSPLPTRAQGTGASNSIYSFPVAMAVDTYARRVNTPTDTVAFPLCHGIEV